MESNVGEAAPDAQVARNDPPAEHRRVAGGRSARIKAANSRLSISIHTPHNVPPAPQPGLKERFRTVNAGRRRPEHRTPRQEQPCKVAARPKPLLVRAPLPAPP